MNLPEAYSILGLDEPNEFLEQTTGDHRTGATTRMLVEAALAFLDGRNVVLIGRTLPYAEILAKTCLKYTFKLAPSGLTFSYRPIGSGMKARVCQLCEGGGLLYWESERTIQRFRIGREGIEEFSDAIYQQMTVARRDGPFAEIRKLVRRDDGSYAAHDARGTFLLDLTKEGGEQIAEADPYRIVVED